MSVFCSLCQDTALADGWPAILASNLAAACALKESDDYKEPRHRWFGCWTPKREQIARCSYCSGRMDGIWPHCTCVMF